ncbi:hypothetical protein FOA52_007254 [Chlamydomonas sp. UWO 241]|nr:hypothetical protein FOA52_007254 [Chlamydomonas sp. UWO 241]
MNAFDVLLGKGSQGGGGSGQRKKARLSGGNASQSASQRTYSQCPICERSIPEAFMATHAANCMGDDDADDERERGSQQGGGAAAVPVGTSGAGQPAQPRRGSSIPSGPGLGLGLSATGAGSSSDPLQGGSWATDTPPYAASSLPGSPSSELHAPGAAAAAAAAGPASPSAACEGQRLGGGDGGEASDGDCGDFDFDNAMTTMSPTRSHGDDEDGGAQRRQQQQPSSSRPSASASQAAQAGGRNGLALLMGNAQAAARSAQVFFLERTPSGEWAFHWWAKGAPAGVGTRPAYAAAWSMQVSVGAAGGGGKGGASTPLTLATNVASGEGGPVDWSDPQLPSNAPAPPAAAGEKPEGRWKAGASMGLLKSALQKAVRRGQGPAAVRLLLHMLKEDPDELLRRLSVIAIEDAMLHPDLPLVVWLMAATAKGYAIGRSLASVLLRFVYQLARCPVRDVMPDPRARPGKAMGCLGDVDAESGLGSAESALLKALLVRAAYGGMACDVAMLRNAAAYWGARFAGGDGGAAPPPPLAQQAQQAQHPPAAAAGGGDGGGAGEQPGPAEPSISGGVCDGDGDGDGTGEDTLLAAGASGAAGDGGGGTRAAGSAAPPAEPGDSCDGDGDGEDTGDVTLLAAPGSIISAAQLMSMAIAKERGGGRSSPGPGGATGGAAATLGARGAPAEQHAVPRSARSSPGPEGASGGAAGDADATAGARGAPADQNTELGPEGTPGCSSSCAAAAPPPPSPWLVFVCRVLAGNAPPPELACPSQVGPLRQSDVPLAAVDFHCSDVLQHLMPRVLAAAAKLTGASWGQQGDPDACLRSAMWLFRSGLSHKRLLHTLYLEDGAGGGSGTGGAAGMSAGAVTAAAHDGAVPQEYMGAAIDAERDAADRERLQPLWAAAAAAADAYSIAEIKKRFAAPAQKKNQQ